MFLEGVTRYGFKNETGETIPPYGVVIVTGATLVENEIVFSIKKCTQTEEDLQEPASLLFNSIQPVDDDQFGVGTRDFPVQALIEQASDHASGTIVGPKAGSFALATVGSCFRIMAKDTTNPTVISNRGVYFIEAYHGKTDFHIARATSTITAAVGATCGSGTAMLKRINSSNQLVDDRSVTITNPGTGIANGTLIYVWRTRKDYVAVEVCP